MLRSRKTKKRLTSLLTAYGQSSDAGLIIELMDVYHRAVHECPEQWRRELLRQTVESAVARRHHVNALMPFLFVEPDVGIVSTAALHAAPLWPCPPDDPLLGVRELVGHARDFIESGDERRAVACFAGLLLLGDRRVVEAVGPIWRELSAPARRSLIPLINRPWAALIEWMLWWMAEADGDEFGLLAGSLASIPTAEGHDGVHEVSRAMPLWSRPPEDAMVSERHWTYAEYALHIRPRLLQIAADEQPPRVMFDVLKRWQIPTDLRLHPDVRMTPLAPAPQQKGLLDRLPPMHSNNGIMLPQPVPLSDADFLGPGGSLVVSWMMLNPFGSTWNCLGLRPTEDPAWQIGFYRMLEPFQQESFALALIPSVDGKVASDSIAAFVRGSFAGSAHTAADLPPRGYSVFSPIPPDLVEVHWNPAELEALVLDAIRHASDLHALDRLNDRLGVAAWLRALRDEQQRHEALQLLPTSWHGAIELAGGEMAFHAFTFWQLDDFLSRHGYPHFRQMSAPRP